MIYNFLFLKPLAMKNNIRFDLSNYLIHFFRDIDLEGGNWVALPEQMGWENIYEDTFIPSFYAKSSTS